MKVAVFARRMLVAGESLAALFHPVHWRPLLGMLARIVKLCRWSFWCWQGNNISDAVTSAMMNQFARELTSSLLGKYFASTRVSVWWAENDSWRLHIMLEIQAFVDALTVWRNIFNHIKKHRACSYWTQLNLHRLLHRKCQILWVCGHNLCRQPDDISMCNPRSAGFTEPLRKVDVA